MIAVPAVLGMVAVPVGCIVLRGGSAMSYVSILVVVLGVHRGGHLVPLVGHLSDVLTAMPVVRWCSSRGATVVGVVVPLAMLVSRVLMLCSCSLDGLSVRAGVVGLVLVPCLVHWFRPPGFNPVIPPRGIRDNRHRTQRVPPHADIHRFFMHAHEHRPDSQARPPTGR
ncbi:hypothetical protein [Georgenia yuyongxinii]|uniref:hypothetical protein n=1 Tax=Georgenia yuyongxinii TaxID=2589797 RepID=UPI001E5FA033|nr:hypothetical protein [Georgenia yuyongxinii]